MTDAVREPAGSVARPAGPRTPSSVHQGSRLSLVAFLLALLMTATTTLVAVWWDPVDARLVTAADDAGWVAGSFVPHQQLLWLGINGAVLLSVASSVVTFIALRRSRRSQV